MRFQKFIPGQRSRIDIGSFRLFFALLFGGIMIVALEVPAHAQSRIDELKDRISTREEEIKKLEEEIADYKLRLESVAGQRTTLQNAVQTIDLTRAKLTKDIMLTEKKIDQTSSVISDIEAGVKLQESKINKSRLVIKDIILRIDQADSDTLVEVMLGNDSVSDFVQELDDLERVRLSVRDNIKSLERYRQELTGSREMREKERKNLLALSNQLDDKKRLADAKRKEQNLLLATTKNQESNYKKMLSDRETRKKQFEREIEDFEAQLRAEIDPNSFPSPGTKVLGYPVENVVVTQKFGKTKDARRLYLSGTHSGMDFRATPGTKIIAAADGVVREVGDTDKACAGASYGKWVLIDHKNGLSTIYAHLDLIKVEKGQGLEIGDLVGYSGSTGYATGPHLHFGLFVSSAVQISDIPSKSCKNAVFHIPAAPSNAYLDPMDYL
jgi:murein DD-endopeptidase MepM/ murein hydrolase activator NlpD